MTDIKLIFIKEERFYYSLSFDIDDFIGDGIWWFQIYDSNKKVLYDEPFAGSNQHFNVKDITKATEEALAFMKII